MKIQFDNGKIAEFDGTPTDEDIEEAYQASGGKQAQLSSQLDKVGGAIEGGFSALTGLASAIPTGIRTLGELAATGDLNEAVERAKSTSDAATYTPRSQAGKKAAATINQTMQDYASEVQNKFAGDVSYLNQEKLNKGTLSASDLKAENTEQLVGGLIGNLYAPGIPLAGIGKGGKVLPKMKGANPEGALADLNAPNVDRPDINLNEGPGTGTQPLYADQRGVVTPTLPDAGVAAAKTNIESARRASIMDAPEFKELWDKAVADGDQALIEKLQAIDEQINQRQDGAQAAVDARQAQMEQEVAQRTSLDMNAAERARQEAAPTGYQEHLAGQAGDAAIGQTAEGLVSPATGAQRGIRAEQPVSAASPEILYQDPQGQTFRGDPNDPNARLAYDRQTEAADNANTYGQVPQKGQPLDLLSKSNLDAANEGPQFPSMEEGMQSQFKQTLLDKAIEDHPLMQKQQERISKQEQLVAKLSEQVEKGKAAPALLARAMKDLDNFEASAERLKQNLTDNLPEGRPTLPFNFKKQGGGINMDAFKKAAEESNKSEEREPIRTQAEQNLRDVLRQDAKSHVGSLAAPVWQRGAINPAVFKEGFEKLKQLADGTWLRAHSDGRVFSVSAIRDSKELGRVDFIKPAGNEATANLKSDWTSVAKEARRQNLATEMYKFTRDLGNDIRRSSEISEDGLDMWRSFENNGLAKNGLISRDGTVRSPGNKQRGALLIDPKDQDKGKFLENNPALKLPTIVPEKLTADKVVEMGKTMKDVDQNALQKIANYLTKGGLYQALKTDNPVIKFGVEKITEADRLARGDIQDYVHDRLGPVTRALSDKEKAEIWLVASEADRLKKPLDLDSLAKNGYSEKQLKWAQTHREVMNKAFDAINQARKSAGLEPIERRVAYAAMKASGDYRRLVYKADDVGQKNVVGIVGADTRRSLEQRMDALIQKGYTNFGEEQYFGGVPRDRGSAQQAMTHAIEILAEKDPRIKEFLDVVDSINKNEAYSFLNAKKHTMDKKGVFGMEGRKLYNTALDNAKEGMQAQLSYAESALKWGRLSEAIEAIRPVLASKDLNMPKAKEWTEGYVKNALGYNPSELGHHLEMAFAKGMRPIGIGYSNVRSAVAVSRKLINTMLLGLNPGFWFTNVVQPMKAMPGMKAYLVSKGLDANFDFGTGWSYIAKAGLTEWKSKYGTLNKVEKGAYDYALSHHVYGSEMVEHSNKATKDFSYYTDKAGGVLSGPIEAGTRRMMYMSFVDMLHQNGLSVKNGLYEAAHNLTDMTMNNYSPTERPKMYNSMGPLGDMAVNLSSYKHNELSRTALFARQIAQDKSAKPLLTELAAGIAFAGLTGTIAFDEADQVYKFISGLIGHPDSLSLQAIKLSERAGKMMGNSDKAFNNSDYVLSHGMFSMLGVDIAKRVGLNNVIPETAADAVFPGVSKLGSMAKATYQAVAPDFMPGSNGGPSKMNTLRAVREDSPNIVASNMDLSAFSKGNLGNNPNNLNGQVVRTPTDIVAKHLGVQGIHESVEKAKTYETKYIQQKYEAARVGPLNRARDELYSTGRVSPATAKSYLDADGDIGSLVADLARFAKEQNMPAKDLAMLKASMSQSIANLHHLQRMKAAYENK